MSARDELMKLVWLAGSFESSEIEIGEATDAILAAGYRKTSIVTTIGTLPTLVGSVILTEHGKVMVLMPGTHSQNHWLTPASSIWWNPVVDWLPAVVLHEPEVAS